MVLKFEYSRKTVSSYLIGADFLWQHKQLVDYGYVVSLSVKHYSVAQTQLFFLRKSEEFFSTHTMNTLIKCQYQTKNTFL